jgi:hypothetical protein
MFIPGLHFTSVGTVRDAAKWPRRDRRKGRARRDKITFDVLSPYTAGKMLKANVRLEMLQQKTDKSVEEVSVGGALVKRPILRSSQKYYRNGIEVYLLECVMEKLENWSEGGRDFRAAFACESGSLYSDEWLDIGGQLMGQERLRQLQAEMEAGAIATIERFYERISNIEQAYAGDEWVWVKRNFKNYFGIDLDSATETDICDVADRYLQAKSKFLRLVIADAEKEFAELSRTGFGQDGSSEDVEKDFAETRGFFEENAFVKELKQQLELLSKRVEKLKRRFCAIGECNENHHQRRL